MSSTFTRFGYARACMLVCALTTTFARADTFNVPDDFATIQDAIDAAVLTAGSDQILIEADVYTENLVLTDNIELRGEETARTIVSGGGGSLMQISNLSGVTIRNLTFNGGDIGIELIDSTSINIHNNVFVAGGTAISVDAGSEADIRHNTFHGNALGVVREADTTIIKNNIFSANNTDFDDGAGNNVNIESNCHEDDPPYADIDALDFHLQTGSPCKDAGDVADPNDAFDDSRADAGAYGGELADTTPFPVGRPNADVNASATAGQFDVTLTWEQNLSYLTTGYEIHYDDDQSDGYANEEAVGRVGSHTLSNLLSGATVPDAPELETLEPSNRSLSLRWSAVDGATGYRIEYGIASVDENAINVGNITAHELTNLENGETYHVRVSALQQTQYFFALKVVGTPATAISAFSPERAVAVGPAQASTPSNERSGIPEPVQPFPLLPDQGDPSCFIATAAYGHFSHPQVQLLRDFRDRFLLTNTPGRTFVRWYYRHSPPAAAFIAQHDTLRMLVRGALLPLIAAAYLMMHAPALTLVLLLCLMLAVPFILARGRAVRQPVQIHL